MKRKLYQIVLGILIPLILIMGIFLYFAHQRNFREASERTLQASLQAMTKEVYRHDTFIDSEVKSRLEDMAASFGMYVEFLDSSGNVLLEVGNALPKAKGILAQPVKGRTLSFFTANDEYYGKSSQYIEERNITMRSLIRLEKPSFFSFLPWIPYLGMGVLAIVIALALLRVFSSEVIGQVSLIQTNYERLLRHQTPSPIYTQGIKEFSDLANVHNEWLETYRDQVGKLTFQRDYFYLAGKKLGMGIFVIDGEEKVIFANDVACRFLRKKEEDIIGKDYFRVLSYAQLLDSVEQAITDMKYVSTPIIENISSSEIYRCHVDRITRDSFYFGVVVSMEDITEKQEILQSRKELMDNLSHELRSPLTSIMGFVETVMNPSISEETRNRFLSIVYQESQRLYSLIQDVNQLKTIEKSEKKYRRRYEFNPYETLENMVPILESICEQSSVRLLVESQPTPSEIFGSEDQFHQLLINLVDNAVKYRSSTDPFVEVQAYNDEQYFFVSVKDNGIGIDKKDQKRVFERFYQVDKVRSSGTHGSGLGLSIVKHIVLTFNGTIELISELHKGSQFIIKIPLTILHSFNSLDTFS